MPVYPKGGLRALGEPPVSATAPVAYCKPTSGERRWELIPDTEIQCKNCVAHAEVTESEDHIQLCSRRRRGRPL